MLTGTNTSHIIVDDIMDNNILHDLSERLARGSRLNASIIGNNNDSSHVTEQVDHHAEIWNRWNRGQAELTEQNDVLNRALLTEAMNRTTVPTEGPVVSGGTSISLNDIENSVWNETELQDFHIVAGGAGGGGVYSHHPIPDLNPHHHDIINPVYTNANDTITASSLDWTNACATYSTAQTYNACLFCDSIIYDKYDFICEGCYEKLSNNIGLLSDYVRNICESGSDVILKLNMIGILLAHKKIIDSFNMSKSNIHTYFIYSINGKRTTLINKILDSPTDIVPREMFMVD